MLSREMKTGSGEVTTSNLPARNQFGWGPGQSPQRNGQRCTDVGVRGLLDANTPVRVETRGGMLTARWAGEGRPVLMTGPAVTVFEGEIELPPA